MAHKTPRGRITLIYALLLATVLTACASDDTATETPTVVATTTMLGDIVENIVAEDMDVVVLMPVGADPHDFQASSQQVSTLSTADLVVANGLGLEEGLHDVISGAESDGTRVIEVGPVVDPLPFSDETTCDPSQEGHVEGPATGNTDHEQGSCDPHVWMDPIRMADAALLIAAELDVIAPDGPWTERATGYAHQLLDANTRIEATFSQIPVEKRVMVTNHEAFGYFARLYDFEIVGTVVPGGSTLGAPSSSQLAELVRIITERGVPAIFTDSSASPDLAEAIAAEVGSEVAVIELYSGSLGEPGSDADSLIGMLETNASKIANSLS